MRFVMNQVFENETIQFDGFHYIGCSFLDCTVLITSMEFGFDRCSFSGTTFHVAEGLPLFLDTLTYEAYDADAEPFELSGGKIPLEI